jgi:DNA mismatch repair ATPase MutL
MHVLSECGMNVWQVWRRYEMKHKPAFILDFRLPQNFIDVNLTPDKREVAMMHESSILDALRNYMDLVSLCMYSCMYELHLSLYVNNFSLFF